MKRLRNIVLCLTVVIVSVFMAGCTKVQEGNYKEGTYFGYDDVNKYTAVVYVDSNGMIKSVFIDAAYSTKGADNKDVYTTKQILGTAYGMKKASKINAEWYEQVKHIADKVVAEQGIDWLKFKYRTVGTDGKYAFTSTLPTGQTTADMKYTDSVSGVTIHVDESYRAIKMALDKAKK